MFAGSPNQPGELRVLDGLAAADLETEAGSVPAPPGSMMPPELQRVGDAVVRLSRLLLLGEEAEPELDADALLDVRAGSATALGRLAARAGLDPIEELLLAICAAAELEPTVARALSAHLGSAAQSSIRGDVLCTIASGFEHPVSAVATALMADARLLRAGLLTSTTSATAAAGDGQANLFRRFAAAPRVVQHLAGQPLAASTQPRLRPIAARTDETLVPPVLRDQVQQDAVGLLEHLLFVAPRTAQPAIAGNLWLAGPAGIGRRTTLATALARRGVALLALDAGDARGVEPARLAAILRREALLHHAVICVGEGTAPTDGDGEASAGRADDALWQLYRALTAARVPAAFVSALPPDARDIELPPRVVRLAPPAPSARLVLWRRLLPTVADLEQVAARFQLAPARITVAAEGARALAAADHRPVGAHDVARAISLSVSRRIAQLGTLIEASQSWDDVVLPPDTLESIQEIIDRSRHRYTVLEQWGFRAHLGKGTGLAALFGGPPGTGKTLVASLIARDLDQELYQIDLARMVSKWIGETEKNLAGVFDAADGANVVLLFDEADALFARRSEVKSSNDRHANAEVNYLLQRIERFEGLCILTTNLETQIDPAFKRRLAFRITFEAPGEDERLRLWRRLVPARAPLAADVDFARLARDHELTGGNIKNALLRAAFLAAPRDGRLTMADLQRAIRLEYRDAGKLTPVGRLHHD